MKDGDLQGRTGDRVVFLDYLRVVACFMVMVVHACEQYYFGTNGNFFIASQNDAFWVAAFDSAVRASVPLFVMASAYLLFPLTRPAGEFFRRRVVRVLVPFAIWTVVYTLRFDGRWSELMFNFPMTTGGHLWFVPMLCGLYLVMPLLSPWAERVSARELKLWIAAWLVTTAFPYLRCFWSVLYGAPSYGAIPYLYGECPWNGFGTFHYVSGFIGYLFLGFYARKFLPEISLRRTLAAALPLWLVGWLAIALPFFLRIPDAAGYPVASPYATAVELEMSWEFCSTGVACTVIAYFLLLRRCRGTGWFYRLVVRPLSEASYGTYLLHMLVLVEIAAWVKPHSVTPCGILTIAVATFCVSSLVSLLIRRIPLIGRAICG